MKSGLRQAVVALAFALGSPSALHSQGNDLQSAYAAAQSTLAKGDLDGARRQFATLSRAHPEIAELHATLGALLFQQGSFTDSRAELEQARRLKPSLPNLNGLIAMSDAELGHYDTAIPPLETTFRAAPELPLKRQTGLELERAYTATGQDSKAVAVALELQQIFPQDPEILYHNERIFGNFAFQTVQTLARVAPDSVWRFQAQAEAEESQGSHDLALASYRHALAIDPAHPNLHYRIGRVLREQARDNHHPEDLAAAMTEFQAELEQNPSNANAAYEIGELHRLAGDLPAAQTSFQAALALYPDFPEANLGLGTVLAARQQPAAALPFLQKAVDSDPGDEATWYRLSQVQRSLGHTAEQQKALREFQRLRQLQGSGTAPGTGRDVSRQTVDSPDPAPAP